MNDAHLTPECAARVRAVIVRVLVEGCLDDDWLEFARRLNAECAKEYRRYVLSEK